MSDIYQIIGKIDESLEEISRNDESAEDLIRYYCRGLDTPLELVEQFLSSIEDVKDLLLTSQSLGAKIEKYREGKRYVPVPLDFKCSPGGQTSTYRSVNSYFTPNTKRG